MQCALMPVVHDNNIDANSAHDIRNVNQHNYDGITKNDGRYNCCNTWHMLNRLVIKTL